MTIEEQYRRVREKYRQRPEMVWPVWRRLARILLLGAVMATVACGVGQAMAADEPDTADILRVIGRFTSAHACPVAADLAITAAHVTDMRPFDPEIPLWPYRFEGGGGEGIARPRGTQMSADLGALEPEMAFTRWYRRAERAPEVGERVWLLAYDWRRKKSAFGDQIISGKVVRIVAGNIIIDEAVPGGASGSCVLNAKGEVVGILTWGQKTGDFGEVAIAVAVYGEWGRTEAKK